MKLSIKLPLSFAAALVLMLAAALYGIWALHRSLDIHATTVKTGHAQEQAANDLAVLFKTQVQEWKNSLLRGKDPQALDKHWRAFTESERAVAERARALVSALPEGEARSLVEKFAAAHTTMGGGYRRGLDAFRASGFDAAAGDVAVRGMDREPSRLLAEAGDKVGAASAAVAAKAAAAAEHATWVSVGLMLVVFGVGVGGGVVVSRGITRPLGRAVAVARDVAGGDLSRPIDASGQDETAQLLGALQAMQASLAGVVGAVRHNADGVATASMQIAQGNSDLSGRTEQQASALQQTAASMDQLGATVRQNADNASQADQLARSACAVAARGGEAVAQVVHTMQGIQDSSRRIADIIGTIDSIAFQTNILALNAAVEAARAGEQGRGFAVVASEVRSLAGRSADAARDIKALISASVERVDHGTALVDQAGATMGEVVGSIRRVADIVGEISTASREQSTGVSQVGQAVAQIDRATQQNAALVEESAAAAESLKQQAGQLAHSVAVFRLA